MNLFSSVNFSSSPQIAAFIVFIIYIYEVNSFFYRTMELMWMELRMK